MAEKTCLYVTKQHSRDPLRVFDRYVRPALIQFPQFDLRRSDAFSSIDPIEEIFEELRAADLLIVDVSDMGSPDFFLFGTLHRAARATVFIDSQVNPVLPVQNHVKLIRVRFADPTLEAEHMDPSNGVDRLVTAIREALQEAQGAQSKTNEANEHQSVGRRELASRLVDAIDAIHLLRINSVGEIISELELIAAELNRPEAPASALQTLIYNALQAIAKSFDQLKAAKGGRIVIAGIIAALVGGSGWPAATVYALTLAFWQDKATFVKAIEAFRGIRSPARNNKKAR